MWNEIYIVGNVSQDTVYYEGILRHKFWGGGGLNIALSVAYNGCIPHLVSVVGSDSNNLLKSIKPYLDISNIKTIDGNSCCFEMFYSSSGELINLSSKFGVANSLDNHFNSLNLIPSHYHICCRSPLESGIIIEKLVKNNLQFSVDFISSSISDQIKKTRDWLSTAFCVFMNSREYNMVVNEIDTNAISLLVVTSGSKPIRIFKKGNCILEIPCSEENFLDVTGAGDVFCGSFLCNYLSNSNIMSSTEKAIRDSKRSLGEFGAWGLFNESNN